MSFLSLTSSYLLPLRQLGPTDPLTVRCGSFVSFISYLRFLPLRCTRAYQGLLLGANAGGCQVDWRGHRTAARPPLALPRLLHDAPPRRDATRYRPWRACVAAGPAAGTPRHTATSLLLVPPEPRARHRSPFSLPNRAARMVSWLMLVGGFGGWCSSQATKSQIPLTNGIDMMA